VNSV